MFHRFFSLLLLLGLLGLPVVLPLAVGFSTIQPAIAETQPDHPDQSAITATVVQALTFPGQPADANPQVTHTAVVGSYALVDWLLGDGGGEMLLSRQDGTWHVVDGGGGTMDSRTLIELGVPEDVAVQLVQQIQAQWNPEVMP